MSEIRPMRCLIGLSGKIGTGKTAVAEHLMHLGFRRCAFGDFLKQEVAYLLNIPESWCYSAEGKGQPIVGLEEVELDPGYAFPRAVMSLREILQWYGTEYRRDQDPLYWEAQLQAFLDSAPPSWQRVVIDDVRFPAEAALLHTNKGLLVRIDPYPGWEAGPHAAHASETALDAYSRFHLVRRPVFGGTEGLAREIAEVAGARCVYRLT